MYANPRQGCLLTLAALSQGVVVNTTTPWQTASGWDGYQGACTSLSRRRNTNALRAAATYIPPARTMYSNERASHAAGRASSSKLSCGITKPPSIRRPGLRDCPRVFLRPIPCGASLQSPRRGRVNPSVSDPLVIATRPGHGIGGKGGVRSLIHLAGAA